MIFYVFDVSFDMTNIKTHSQKDSYGHAFNYEIGLIPKIDYHLHTWYRFNYSYLNYRQSYIYIYIILKKSVPSGFSLPTFFVVSLIIYAT